MEKPPVDTHSTSDPATPKASAGNFWLVHVLFFWLPLLVLLGADQWTKLWAQNTLQSIGSITVIEGLLNWTYVRNTGVAFGMAQGQNYLLGGIAIVLVGAGLWFSRSLDWTRREVNLVAALIISGAVGNLIDRFSYGYVVDFVDVLIPVIHYPWPVFNIADSAICVAVGWIVLRQFFGPSVEREPSA